MEAKKSIRHMDRRSFIKASTLFAVAVSMPVIVSCDDNADVAVDPGCLTTDDILGPFYKAGSPLREDIIPSENMTPLLKINGRVFSGCDQLLEGAVVEIWNANADGDYDTSEKYDFRGSYKTGQDGVYKFKTIIPGRYLNGSTFRPSHIHFRITAPGHQELVSQIYFKGDPYIEADPWASVPDATLRILEVEKDTDDLDIVTFDIYLNKA